MLAITDYNYFKPAAGLGVSVERSNRNLSLDCERDTSITVIVGTVLSAVVSRVSGSEAAAARYQV